MPAQHRLFTTPVASVYPFYLAKGQPLEKILRA